MSDIHALSGAYATDALDDVERARFERHLAECPACREEVSGLREAAAVLAADAEMAPPARLRARVLADIATVRPLPPRVDVGPPPPAVPAVRPDRRRRWAVLVAAAAAVVAVGAGAVVWQPWGQESTQVTTAADRVLQAPDAGAVTVPLAGGGRATLTRSASERAAVLRTSGLPPAPPGRTYQLWLNMPGAGMVSAGLMKPDGDQTVLLEGDAARATGAGITVEPAGGSPQPTSEPLALIDFAELEPA